MYIQQDGDKLKPIIMCLTSTYQFLRPCLLMTTWLLFKRCETHASTPPIYVYAPSPYSTGDATASELGRRTRSRPLTCSNRATSHVSSTLPQQRKAGGTRAALLTAGSIDICVLCEDDKRVRTRRLSGRGGAQPWTRAL